MDETRRRFLLVYVASYSRRCIHSLISGASMLLC